MKKLILLNAALLIALFSYKFSLKNLVEMPRVLSSLETRHQDPPIQELTTEKVGVVADPPKIEERPIIYVVEEAQKEEILAETPTTIVAEPPVIFAEDPKVPIYAYEEPFEFLQNCDYNPYPLPKRLALSHTEGWGKHIRPYRSNYTMGEILFAPDVQLDVFLPMLDVRGIRFDNGHGALSVGFIGRYIPDPECFCNILGFNVYYDYAPYPRGYENQFSVGVEILGPRFDIRGNFYAPFGEDNDCCKRRCMNGWLAYSFNAEFGYLIAESRCQEFFLYSAVGPYYMSVCKCEEKKRGVLFRLVPQFKDILALDLRYSYDSIFRNVFQAEIILSLPLYQVRRQERGPCGITSRQIYQRVERL